MLPGIVKGINAANYYFWLQELQPVVQETSENRDNGPNAGGPVALDNVRFSYPLRPDATILKGISMTVSTQLRSFYRHQLIFFQRSRKASSSPWSEPQAAESQQ